MAMAIDGTENKTCKCFIFKGQRKQKNIQKHQGYHNYTSVFSYNAEFNRMYLSLLEYGAVYCHFRDSKVKLLRWEVRNIDWSS